MCSNLKKVILGCSVGLGILVLTGCSHKATGPQFEAFQEPSEGNAAVYIYRNDSFAGAALAPAIHKKNLETNQDMVVGKVRPAGFLRTEVERGSHEIWAKTEARNEVKIDAQESEIYCVEHYITMGVFVGHPQFKLVDLQKCEEDIRKTKLSIE